MKDTRVREMVNELVDILLTVTDDVEFVLTRLKQAGFSNDEIRNIGFDI